MVKKNADTISLIPLGGVGEIGKNMWMVEVNSRILVIDAGVMFPGGDLLGIDLIIPDISYLVENGHRIDGIIITHGHEDHIGALPYVLKEINVPVYGTRLALGLIKERLREHNLLHDANLHVFVPGSAVQVGSFQLETIHVNHSIADTCALAIHTPVGVLVYASDFKFDQTPIDGQVVDFQKLAELGENGVLALFSDSTNVERPGYTLSEKEVGHTLDEVFRLASGRIIVATFASNIHRIQQVIDAAANNGRKIALTGRSMVNIVRMASELGYLQIPDGMLIDIADMKGYEGNRLSVLTTGSQGEPMAALTRMARGDHNQIQIAQQDTVVISSTPIPGNEKLVAQTINQLFKKGADVVYEAVSGVHVSGHASREELKLMINLVKPRFLIPVHGEYRHLYHHKQLAIEMGMPSENIFITEPGSILEFSTNNGKAVGRISAGRVLVDGLGVGDVGKMVLRDRRLLSQDGIMIVVLTIEKNSGRILAGPDIISRGFVYIRESEELLKEATSRVEKTLEECEENHITDWSQLKSKIKESLCAFIYQKIKRQPMIMPIIMEVEL